MSLNRKSPLARAGRIKPKPRKPSETRRIYGTPERQAFVRAMPCVVCTRSPVELAHTENGGMGRKAGAETISPLCRYCHMDLHQMGEATFARVYRIDLRAEAARVERLWQERGQ